MNAVLALIAIGIFVAFILPFGLALAFFMGRLVSNVVAWWWEVCSAIAYADWFERKK